MIYCRVNETDYDGDIVIEALDYYPGDPAVPPWEEWGRPDLGGPFATYNDAFNALAEEAALGDGIGVYSAHQRD